ncbi:MAG: hypothetical protein WC348_04055 [Patescibacteria group bacterium]|jgi:outer membrane PBP1 activator LpoA protein
MANPEGGGYVPPEERIDIPPGMTAEEVAAEEDRARRKDYERDMRRKHWEESADMRKKLEAARERGEEKNFGEALEILGRLEVLTQWADKHPESLFSKKIRLAFDAFKEALELKEDVTPKRRTWKEKMDEAEFEINKLIEEEKSDRIF